MLLQKSIALKICFGTEIKDFNGSETKEGEILRDRSSDQFVTKVEDSVKKVFTTENIEL
ncbi:hypothetical protein CWI38_0290p0020 [Hamiltosporidium tvaerminnensis]|uniref:Uncharacterized protein n=1 Tax=Hamiltosporidium tvaerminnensis TaxID=1176355 RepID=A0A4Q9M1K6_9MICR|nr:hypothetical protein CWI38_0290p0020 [Hamiltosporidium tvaerminnensis]